MERDIPKPGQIYRHFKGNLYEIVIIARDSETLEEKVVYKAVEGEGAYVRPLTMFVSKVDKEKYPDATQRYRFELIREPDNSKERKEISGDTKDRALLLEFLELETAGEKVQYLVQNEGAVTDGFLQMAAQSLDFAENKGELKERYGAILSYLRTLEKYECRRLR